MNFPTGFTEWTRTPPSKPGVYVWVHSIPKKPRTVRWAKVHLYCFVRLKGVLVDDANCFLDESGKGFPFDHPRYACGYWSGPLKLPEVKKAVPVAPSAIRYPEIRVGSYTLSPRLGGKIWLQHTSGEGMMTDAAKLEKHLTTFWNKEF